MRKKQALVPFILFVLILLTLNICILVSTKKTQTNIQSYYRLHVIANSNSLEDQLLKYTVSKNLTDYISSIISTSNAENKDDVIKTISSNINNILTISDQCIKQNSNNNYSVKACLGKINYPVKTSDNISMDAGTYDSLKIIIGDGKGENFWSLIYPFSYDGIVSVNKEVDTEDIINNNDITFSSLLLDFFSEIFK